MNSMTPAVRRALELLPKSTAKYSKNIPNPPQRPMVDLSPEDCPYPDNLCLGCQDFEVCGS